MKYILLREYAANGLKMDVQLQFLFLAEHVAPFWLQVLALQSSRTQHVIFRASVDPFQWFGFGLAVPGLSWFLSNGLVRALATPWPFHGFLPKYRINSLHFPF